MSTRAYWIVGPGRVGLSLGSLLAEANIADEILIIGRAREGPQHPLLSEARVRFTSTPELPPPDACLLLAVPDRAIVEAAERFAGLGAAAPGCVALHVSGAQSADVLASLDEAGYATGALHPLSTVADPIEGAKRLKGSFFAFEGSQAARAAASEIVTAAEGRLLDLHAADRARYHAACVFASNYVVACAAVAVRTLAGAAQISEAEAASALKPLWEGAAANLSDAGLPEALTGPIARGDVATVQKHLSDLEEPTRELYRQLALAALEISRAQGLKLDAVEALEKVLGGVTD